VCGGGPVDPSDPFCCQQWCVERRSGGRTTAIEGVSHKFLSHRSRRFHRGCAMDPDMARRGHFEGIATDFNCQNHHRRGRTPLPVSESIFAGQCCSAVDEQPERHLARTDAECRSYGRTSAGRCYTPQCMSSLHPLSFCPSGATSHQQPLQRNCANQASV
jgi:hypothetical protein